jgi:hypothetical protein
MTHNVIPPASIDAVERFIRLDVGRDWPTSKSIAFDAKRKFGREIRGKSRINFLREMGTSPRPVVLFVATNSVQIINQSFRASKVSRDEPLCELVVNWFDDGIRFSATVLIVQQCFSTESARTTRGPCDWWLFRPRKRRSHQTKKTKFSPRSAFPGAAAAPKAATD